MAWKAGDFQYYMLPLHNDSPLLDDVVKGHSGFVLA